MSTPAAVPVSHLDDTRLARDVDQLLDGRVVSVFDRQVVETVVGLIHRRDAARRLLDCDGLVVDTARGVMEHPAVAIEKKCSQELRGWVDTRPDLFGAAAAEACQTSSAGRFERFKNA